MGQEHASTSVLQSLVLISTLSTAVDVVHSVHERRAGRDPSGQEPDDAARQFLREASAELDDLLMRLVVRAGYASDEEDPSASTVRAFDGLMTLHRTANILHEMHQRLLSLYPSVAESLLEEVRSLEAVVRRLVRGAGADEPDSAFAVESAFRFNRRIRFEVLA